MTASRNNLTAPDRFRVSNYVIAHIDELRAMSSNDARAQHVSDALGLSVKPSNLTTAARAANVILTPPSKPKPAPGGVVAALLRELLARTEAAEAALVRAHDRANEQANSIRCLQEAVRVALPAPDVTYRTTLL